MSRCKGWGKHNGQTGAPMNPENYILNRKCAYKLCNLLAKSTGARNRLERKLDEYNHTMELIRTIIPVAILCLQVVILVKII